MRALMVCLNVGLMALAVTVGTATPDDAPKAPPTPVRVGSADSTGWTATTYEAATAEVNKKVLASGKAATVTGEVVDVSCYLQLGKRGEAHIACGSKCIEHGQPIGLVDSDEKLYILFVEEHHPRRDGGMDLKTAFAPLLAKTVTVTGMMTEMKDYRALFVRTAPLYQSRTRRSGGK